MASAIAATTIKSHYYSDTASVLFPGSAKRSGNHYWRGFSSPVGSCSRAKPTTRPKTKDKSGHNRGNRMAPYKKR